MKKYLVILLLFVSINSFSQDSGWSEPVQISTDENASYIDFTIDNNNVIHCVWRAYYDSMDRRIFYSKSEDMGETWSEPHDLSMNPGRWADNPQICNDSQNNIYVIYSFPIGEHTPSKLMFRKYNGEKWSDTVDIAEESPNSEYPCIAIDNNDRVYAFWHMWYNEFHKIHYRYLEDNVWSPTIKPFGDEYNFRIRKAITDKNNNLHCVGQYKQDNETYFKFRAVYFKYNYDNEIWSINKQLSDSISREFIDIDLDSTDLPHIVWAHDVGEMGNPFYGSFYKYFDGSNWSPSRQLDTADAFKESPKISIDKYDNSHILQWKYFHYERPKYYTHTYYENLSNKIYLDSLSYLGHGTIKSKGNTLFMVYTRILEDENPYPFFRKKSLTISSVEFNEEKKRGFRLYQNYPNPFNPSTRINYTIPSIGETGNLNNNVILKVFDSLGRVVTTLVNEYKPPGNYNTIWDGTNNLGKPVSSGVYFYKITAGDYTTTKKMVLLQ